MTRAQSIGWLRVVSIAEAISYLLLLTIAMPLKYGMGLDIAVRICGSLHGGLFVILCVLIILAWWRNKWSIRWPVIIFIASLVPLVPFFVDRHLKIEQEKAQQDE